MRRAKKLARSEPLREEPVRLVLSPTTSAEPGLPGMAEWQARQRRQASAKLLRSELETLDPSRPGPGAGQAPQPPAGPLDSPGKA